MSVVRRDGDRVGDVRSLASIDELARFVSLGFLAGGISHEINNALTSMRLSLGRLVSFEISRRPMSSERMHRIELLQDVREGVARIERIARELKAFSHVEDGEERPIDAQAELDIAIELVAHEIRHRAQLVCDYSPLPPVYARPGELRQVFLDVLLNVVHEIREGEATSREIRVTTRTDELDDVVVEIADSGKDSMICITIASTTEKLEPVNTDEVAAAAAVLGPRRILIIDDDRPVAAAIALELADHDVVVAESGREALEVLRRESDFDLILCDLMMPEVTGIDVYEAARALDPSLVERIVMMTGGAFTAAAKQFLTESNAPLIEKPFQTGELLALVAATPVRRTRRDERTYVARGVSRDLS